MISLNDPSSEPDDMQDGMLAYYLSQVAEADINVEARIAKSYFEWKRTGGNSECATENSPNR